MKYLTDSFILSMLLAKTIDPNVIAIFPKIIKLDEIRFNDVPFFSSNHIVDMGFALHTKAIANFLSNKVGTHIEINRYTEFLQLETTDTLYIAQYFGPRLLDNDNNLPENGFLKYFKVKYINYYCADLQNV